MNRVPISKAAFPLRACEAPSRSFGEPIEIARAIVFLASDDASFITCTMLTADGGFHLTL